MSSEEKLMPCPLCRSKANIEVSHSKIDGVKDRYFPSCLNGDCAIFIETPYTTWSTKREAAAAWNTRPAREEVSGEELNLESLRRREVQMMGAAISTHSWHDMENAYNQLRDKIDSELGRRFRASRAAMNPKPAEAASGVGDHEPGCEHSHCPIRICACPPAEADGEAKSIIDELNACYLYGVSEKSDALAKRIIAHLSRGAEAASDPCKFTDWRMKQLASAMPKEHAETASGAGVTADDGMAALDLIGWLSSTLQLEGEVPSGFRDHIAKAFAAHRTAHPATPGTEKAVEPVADDEAINDALNDILSPFHWEAWKAALFDNHPEGWPDDDEQEVIVRGVDSIAVGEHYAAWAEDARAKIIALFTAPPAADVAGLREALVGMVETYTSLVNSGDAGHWDPEKDEPVISARQALAALPEEPSA